MSPKLILAAIDIASRIDWPEVRRRIKKRIKRMQALQIFTSIFTFIAFWVLATQNRRILHEIRTERVEVIYTNAIAHNGPGLYYEPKPPLVVTNAEDAWQNTNQQGLGFYTFDRGQPFYVTSRNGETNFEVYSNSVYHPGEQWIEYPTAPKPKREVDVQLERQFWRLDIQWTSPEAGAWLKKEAGQFGWWLKSDYRDTSGELWVNRTYDLEEVADYIRQRPWLANPFKP